MKLKLLLFLLPPVMLFACADSSSGEGAPGRNRSSASGTPANTNGTSDNDNIFNAIKMVPTLAQTDSVQVLFYDNPDDDSLRYARFFKYTAVTDTSFINALSHCLQQPVTIEPGVRRCRSIGKMYLFDGDVSLKTIYFSNRADSCSYLYFIQDGSFVYVEMPTLFNETLMNLKAISKTP